MRASVAAAAATGPTLVLLLLCVVSSVSGVQYSVDWSLASTTPFPVSLYASAGDTVVFTAAADASGTLA